jgi:hypothetical protein
MADISLNTVASGYNLSKINDNFATLEDTVNNHLLNLDGGNNTMGQEIDMNSFKIINLADAQYDKDAVNLSQALKIVADVNQGGQGGVPGVSTDVQLFTFVGDGVETDFPIAGATVSDPNFYDTYIAGVGQEPGIAYTIIMGATPDDTMIRFVTPPADGAIGWTVLRGMVMPYSGPPPITTVSPNVTTITNNTTFDNTYKNNLIVITSATDITITIAANTGASTDWLAGDFFSVMQFGTGKVTLVGAGGVSLFSSPGFQASTRGQYSVISASNIGADTNQWAVSGDLLPVTVTPEVHSFILVCSDEATTDLAVGTNTYRFYMPYGLLITDVRATVNVAQTAGTALAFDVKMDGTSIFSSLLTIPNNSNKSTEATTPYVLANAPNDTVLTDGSLVSVDISQVGTAGARGLKIYLIGQRAS